MNYEITLLINLVCIGVLSDIITGNFAEYLEVRNRIAESGRELVIREINQKDEAMQQYPLSLRIHSYILRELTSIGRSLALGGG